MNRATNGRPFPMRIAELERVHYRCLTANGNLRNISRKTSNLVSGTEHWRVLKELIAFLPSEDESAASAPSPLYYTEFLVEISEG